MRHSLKRVSRPHAAEFKEFAATKSPMLIEAACANIFVEQMSGAVADRPKIPNFFAVQS
jgi:hypothetical protein